MDKDHLGIVFIMTLLYFFVELGGGVYFNSLALVTDASFMAINLSGQLLAIYTRKLGERPPDNHKTFGYERAKVLSGLFSGVGIGFILFYVFGTAYRRIISPEPLDTAYVLSIAVIGLLVNLFGAIVLSRHMREINIKGAFLLVLNDLLGSVGVIVSSLIISYTGLYRVDAVTSILIGLLIIYPTYKLVRGSIDILMEGIPAGIEIEQVERFILEHLDHTTVIKGMHVWALVPEKVLLAVKIRTDGTVHHRDRIKNLKGLLRERFGFCEVYIEIYEDEN